MTCVCAPEVILKRGQSCVRLHFLRPASWVSTPWRSGARKMEVTCTPSKSTLSNPFLLFSERLEQLFLVSVQWRHCYNALSMIIRSTIEANVPDHWHYCYNALSKVIKKECSYKNERDMYRHYLPMVWFELTTSWSPARCHITGPSENQFSRVVICWSMRIVLAENIFGARISLGLYKEVGNLHSERTLLGQKSRDHRKRGKGEQFWGDHQKCRAKRI